MGRRVGHIFDRHTIVAFVLHGRKRQPFPRRHKCDISRLSLLVCHTSCMVLFFVPYWFYLPALAYLVLSIIAYSPWVHNWRSHPIGHF